MMLNVQKAFSEFWSSFGIPAYIETESAIGIDPITGQPIAPPLPYITYTFSRDSFFDDNLITARVWTQKNLGTIPALEIMGRIEEKITHNGYKLIVGDNEGLIWLQRGTPFMQWQRITDEDNVRAGYINIVAKSFIL